ncbi:hypothetical protein [Kribbella italica]|uniref:hypothetical protein n=1 Tax=Kribbella italica TaxID=1540520 RepID=UPI003080F7D3
MGSSGVLLITGEPGIGKTTLLDQAAEQSAGLRLLRARGTENRRCRSVGCCSCSVRRWVSWSGFLLPKGLLCRRPSR